ncbi:MFS transporter [Sulfurimonas sp. C5]|uniref:MFS transporter n=1 Tax=Sulfurimonas sp. C5 TaxID=3036947 RepID=UPI0024583135|nr:MFS transporter [Sulfurimonas sp. C5]MDH4944147.1 MFS transporter [Sulfurimonas sp. C5]
MRDTKKIQISLLLIATLGVMSGITVVSSLPLIAHTFSDIEHIEFLSKLMLTIPSMIIALFAPFAGHIVDKFGRLKPLYGGIILFIIGGSSGFYLHDFYVILIGRALLGLAVALIMTSSTALIGDYFSEEARHRFMSKQGMAVALGGIFFISLGGLLAQLHWSYPFAIYLIPLLFFPLLLTSLYEPKKYTQINEDLDVETKLFPVYLTAFFVMVLFYMLPTQLPYLIVNILGGKPQTVGFVIATAMTFNALTSMQYAKIKAKFSYIQIYMATFVLFSLGVFIVSQANSIADLFFATAPLGMAFGLLLVNTNAWFLSQVPPHKRGKASGMLTSSFFLGQFSSPLLFEPIVLAYGIQGLFFIVSLVALCVAVFLFVKGYK